MKELQDLDFEKLIILLEPKKVWWDESVSTYRDVALQVILSNNDAIHCIDEVKKILEDLGLYVEEGFRQSDDIFTSDNFNNEIWLQDDD